MTQTGRIEERTLRTNEASTVAGVRAGPGTIPRPKPAFVPGRRHVLDLDDFSVAEIEDVFQNADAMREVMNREIKKVPTLRGKTVITLFTEASTRTRVSFEQAGKILSADVINVSGSGSSVEKGESLYNTALTLQAMNADIIIIRHAHSGAPHFLARHLDACVINAGDGTHAHPTQALLDAYTMRNYFGAVEGLRVTIVGDVMYSRVARSNLWGLTKMGAEVTLCAPRTLIPQDMLHRSVEPGSHPFDGVKIEHDLAQALAGADVVYALRLQLERQRAGHLPSLREYSRSYGIDRESLMLASPHALVMHPGPMNEGVEIDPEVAHGSRSVIEEQVTNGVAIRMALLYSVATPIRESYVRRATV